MIIRSINSFFSRYSRWVFGIFTLIIIVAFMGIMTPGQLSGCFAGKGTQYGRILGQDVSYEELSEFMRKSQLIMYAYGFQGQSIKPEEAFSGLAAIKAAESRGIAISDDQVVEMLKNMPIFMDQDRKFSETQYKSFISNLAMQGFSEADFMDSIRYQLIGSKLMQEIGNSVIITNNEVEDFYKVVNTKFDVKRFELKFADLVNSSEPKAEDLEAYFATNQDNYMTKGDAKVILAKFEFNAPEITKQAEEVATDELVKSFYDANKTMFTEQDKGVIEFDKAKDKAKAELVKQISKELTMRQANKFAKDVYSQSKEDPNSCGKNFVTLAKELNVQLLGSADITAKSTKIGDVEIPALVKNIFASNIDVNISNAVMTDSAVYVAYFPILNKVRKATLAEAKAEVIVDYNISRAVIAGTKTMDALYNNFVALDKEELAKKINDNSKFVEVKDFDYRNDIAGSAVLTVATGGITKPVTTSDSVILLYVTKRILPDMKSFEAEKAMWEAQYRQVKSSVVVNDFNNYLSSQCQIFNAQ